MNRRVVWLMLLPLVAGLLIYVFFRTGSYLADLFPASWKWQGENKTVLFVIGWLPDFLWCFSFANFLFTYRLSSGFYYSFIVLLILLIGELIQGFFNTAFTFDYFDLLAAVIAWLMSLKMKTLFYEK